LNEGIEDKKWRQFVATFYATNRRKAGKLVFENQALSRNSPPDGCIESFGFWEFFLIAGLIES